MYKLLFPIGIILAFVISDVRVSGDGIRLSKNLHVVDEGKFYRSAQLTEKEFSEVIKKYGIKTVINLQGDRPGYNWYDKEINVTKSLSVKHIDISMATENIPRRENLLKLLDAYKKSERPILIHCRSGADRAGEASAIYAMEYMKQTKEEALKMLAWKYWHVEYFAPSKRYFIGLYQGEQWAKSHYNPCQKEYQYSDRRTCGELSYFEREPAAAAL